MPQSARWSEAARGEEVERILAAGDPPAPAVASLPATAAAATLVWCVPFNCHGVTSFVMRKAPKLECLVDERRLSFLTIQHYRNPFQSVVSDPLDHAVLPSTLVGVCGNIVRTCRAYTILGLKLPPQLTSEAASPAEVAASEADVPVQVAVTPFSSCTGGELLGLEHDLRCLNLP